MAILQAMLVHGMIIQGMVKGDHYGPVSIGAPDDRAAGFCKDLANKICELVNKIK